MKLLFKQKMFSWLDSYDIYNEQGEVVFTVKGQLDWGHCLKIYDSKCSPICRYGERKSADFSAQV